MVKTTFCPNQTPHISSTGGTFDDFPWPSGWTVFVVNLGVFLKVLPDYLCYMRILVDCRSLQYDPFNGEKVHFIIKCADILSQQYGVEWLWLVDKGYKDDMLPGISPDRLVIRSALPGKAGWKYWKGWQVPRQVKKFGAALVMTTGNRKNTRISAPQCLWDWEGWMPGGAGPVFQPPAPGERAHTKSLYAEGREYFISLISGLELSTQIDLLKAFSAFKKRQRSNLGLILATREIGFDPGFTGKLDTYKYRADIHLYDRLSAQEMARLVGASYACIILPDRGSLGMPVLEAWKSESPVILVASSPRWEQLANAAVLPAKPGDIPSIAARMMEIYKDEALRNNLIEKGRARCGSFSWERSAAEVWNAISRAMDTKSPI